MSPYYHGTCGKCGANFTSYEAASVCMACVIKKYLPEQAMINPTKPPRKHAELIKAWADGATIQHKTAGHWFTTSFPKWDADTDYRIKPEKVVRWQWVVVPNRGGQRGKPELTARFFKDENTLARDMGGMWDVVGKAEWTRMEFDE